MPMISKPRKFGHERGNTNRHCSLPKIKILERDTNTDLTLPCAPNLERTIRGTSAYKSSKQTRERNLEEIEGLIGKSLNEVLHKYLPSVYVNKNSKLSNYNFLRSAKSNGDIRETLIPLLQKPVLQARIIESRAQRMVRKTSDKVEKNSRILTQIKEVMEKKLKLRRTEMELVPLSLEKRRNAVSEQTGMTAESEAIFYQKRLSADAEEHVSQLLRKYTAVWNANRDFSTRKVFDFQTKDHVTVKSH